MLFGNLVVIAIQISNKFYNILFDFLLVFLYLNEWTINISTLPIKLQLKAKSNCWTMAKNIFHLWIYIISIFNPLIWGEKNIRRKYCQSSFVHSAMHFRLMSLLHIKTKKKEWKNKLKCKTKDERANYNFKMVAFILLAVCVIFCCCVFINENEYNSHN